MPAWRRMPYRRSWGIKKKLNAGNSLPTLKVIIEKLNFPPPSLQGLGGQIYLFPTFNVSRTTALHKPGKIAFDSEWSPSRAINLIFHFFTPNSPSRIPQFTKPKRHGQKEKPKNTSNLTYLASSPKISRRPFQSLRLALGVLRDRQVFAVL